MADFSHCVDYQTHPNKSPLETFAINRFWLTGSLYFREYWKAFAFEVEVSPSIPNHLPNALCLPKFFLIENDPSGYYQFSDSILYILSS